MEKIYMNYKKILLGLELNDKNDTFLLEKALDMAKTTGADLGLVHAVEFLGVYGTGYGITASAEFESALFDAAVRKMGQLAEKFGIAPEKTVVKFGSAKFVILDEAAAKQADLIMVGSHGRSGISLLLGSTANAVLHGAKCDVIAIRLPK
jgi:universal stress protein A